MSLPYHFALWIVSVIFSVRYPHRSIRHSFTANNAKSAHIHGYRAVRQITSVACVSLSATGSSTFPTSETMLNFLAIFPSIISVNPESAITMIVHRYAFYAQYNQMMNGIKRIRIRLNRFGIVSIFSFFKYFLCILYSFCLLNR